jgi:urea transport system ATP-binding protein
MLSVRQVNQYYGGSHILRDVEFDVPDRSCTALLGRNGVGKTTLLKAIMGLLPVRSGSIKFGNTELVGKDASERAHVGIGFVPQGREIFGQLTVEENLRVGVFARSSGKDIPELVFRLFPVLKTMMHRRGGDLSGGQQQQLAIARALATKPKVLLLDEPTEGIQPSIIKEMARTLKRIRDERGLSIVVSEQVLSFALDIADRVLVIENGEIVRDDKRDAVDAAQISKFLSV